MFKQHVSAKTVILIGLLVLGGLALYMWLSSSSNIKPPVRQDFFTLYQQQIADLKAKQKDVPPSQTQLQNPLVTTLQEAKKREINVTVLGHTSLQFTLKVESADETTVINWLAQLQVAEQLSINQIQVIYTETPGKIIIPELTLIKRSTQ